MADADLVLIAGSKMTASDTAQEHPALLDPERQVMLQIDMEPRNLSWCFPVEHPLLGEAGTVLDLLRGAFPGAAGSGVDRVAAYRRRFGYFDTDEPRSDVSAVSPQRIVAELQRALPVESMVACDAGENRIFMTHFLQTKSAGTFIQAAGAGPMGFAVPAAMAAKLVYSDRVAVAVCGDGGFAMTMNGLLTAIESDLPIVVVVFNNQALGWSMHSHGNFATQFNRFDHAAIARSNGCHGISVRAPDALAGAFAGAFERREPTVIDVETSLGTTLTTKRSLGCASALSFSQVGGCGDRI